MTDGASAALTVPRADRLRSRSRIRRMGPIALLGLWALWQTGAAAAGGDSAYAANRPAAEPDPIAAPRAHDPTALLDRLMSLLGQRRRGEVSFTEHDTLRVLTHPMVSSGVLIYVAPDHLEKRTLQPRKSTLILDHGTLMVSAGGRSYHLELSDYPQIAPYVQAIADTLSGNRAALERLFQVDFAGTLAHWTLTLTPRAGQHSPIRRIRIEGTQAELQLIVIEQTHGERSQLILGPPPANP